MNLGKCRFCGEKINKWFYSNALYCSDKCRKRFYDITHRPESNRKASKLVEGVVIKENEVFDNEQG